MNQDEMSWTTLIFNGSLIVLAIIAIVWLLNALWAIYNVWSSKKRGEADLAEARYEQMIQKAEAEGRLAAAQLNMDAEVIDARAVAKSVEIIGKALHENEGYMRWQWIRMMEHRKKGDTIYVPTETNLPILEAGRFQRKVGSDTIQ